MKKEIQNKINDIDQMMNELGLQDIDSDDNQTDQSIIDINGLDVLEVLNNILN